MSKAKKTSRGVGFLGVVFIVLATLKVVGVAPVAGWSWWWVASPLWGAFVILPGIAALALGGLAAGGLLAAAWSAPSQWMRRRKRIRAYQEAQREKARLDGIQLTIERTGKPLPFSDGWRAGRDAVVEARKSRELNSEEVSDMWRACRKRPVVVHVRDAVPGEEVFTREGLAIAMSDDLVMRGVDGELYPISRSIFARTYDEVNATDVAEIQAEVGKNSEVDRG